MNLLKKMTFCSIARKSGRHENGLLLSDYMVFLFFSFQAINSQAKGALECNGFFGFPLVCIAIGFTLTQVESYLRRRC